MTRLERIICHGNRTLLFATNYDAAEMQKMLREPNQIESADGFTMSVIAGGGCYCTPRPGMNEAETYRGPYTHVEVGFPSARPEPWDEWAQYADSLEDDDEWDTVYGYVPVELVRRLVADHGGEV